MDGISVAESARAKKAPKVLRRLAIEPKMGGGHTLVHEYTNYQHQPEEHHFGPEDHDGFYGHIAKHTGRPHPEIAEHEESEPQSYEREKGIAK